MLTHKLAEQIIGEAISAPSGDNYQPWQFVVGEGVVKVFDAPEIDSGIYNFKNRGSYIAHGALIENITIVAKHFGFSTEVILCPDVARHDHIASIIFVGQSIAEAGLYPAIARRATNRKKYYKIPLTVEEKVELSDSVVDNEGRVVFVEESSAKTRLAKALVVSERLMLENKAVHDYLFANICWTKEDVEIKKSGLYAATLELAPPKLFVFKKCQNWIVAKFLSTLGLSRVVAADNAKLYSSSPAFGAILIKDQEIVDFVKAGRLMQRLWLRATILGISIQPVAAIPYIAQRLMVGDITDFSPNQVKLVTNSYSIIQKEFGVTDEIVALVFRLGQAPPPSALSPRRKPKIIFQS